MRAWNADEFGMTPDDHAEIACSIHQWDLEQRWSALRALWGRPIIHRVRKDGVIEHTRTRTEEWTPFRAIRATVGLVLGIPAAHRFSRQIELAFWDSGPIYGGWTAKVVVLEGFLGIHIWDDTETSL